MFSPCPILTLPATTASSIFLDRWLLVSPAWYTFHNLTLGYFTITLSTTLSYLSRLPYLSSSSMKSSPTDLTQLISHILPIYFSISSSVNSFLRQKINPAENSGCCIYICSKASSKAVAKPFSVSFPINCPFSS